MPSFKNYIRAFLVSKRFGSSSWAHPSHSHTCPSRLSAVQWWLCFFPSYWSTSVPILWIPELLQDCRDFLFSCPMLQPRGNWIASVLWGCYEGKQALDTTCWLSVILLGSSEIFHRAKGVWDQISLFHRSAERLKSSTNFIWTWKTRLNATEKMPEVCVESVTGVQLDILISLDFKKLPQRPVCIWFLAQPLDLSL